MLTREQLVKPRTKTVTIEGGEVVIRALTADEGYSLRGKDIGKDDIYGIISKSLVEPVLSVEDVGSLPASTVTALTNEIFLFNALGPKAINDAEKELKKAPTEGATTT